MKLFFESLVVFFATLMAAALVALGAPAGAELDMTKAAARVSLQQATPTASHADSTVIAWLGLR
jgi:hypothetical protein